MSGRPSLRAARNCVPLAGQIKPMQAPAESAPSTKEPTRSPSAAPALVLNMLTKKSPCTMLSVWVNSGANGEKEVSSPASKLITGPAWAGSAAATVSVRAAKSLLNIVGFMKNPSVDSCFAPHGQKPFGLEEKERRSYGHQSALLANGPGSDLRSPFNRCVQSMCFGLCVQSVHPIGDWRVLFVYLQPFGPKTPSFMTKFP